MRSMRAAVLVVVAVGAGGSGLAAAASTAPKPVIRKAVLMVDKGGAVVPMGCNAKEGVCAGRITLRSTSGKKLGSLAYRLGAGKRAPFRVRVSAATRNRSRTGMKARATATAGKVRASRAVTLRLRKSR